MITRSNILQSLEFTEEQLLDSILVFLHHGNNTQGKWGTVENDKKVRALISNTYAKLLAFDHCPGSLPAQYSNILEHPVYANSRNELTIPMEALVYCCFYTGGRDITVEQLVTMKIKCFEFFTLREDIVRMKNMLLEWEKMDQRLVFVPGLVALEIIEE